MVAIRSLTTGIQYYNELRFEWHDEKAEANLRTHGVSFDSAATVFRDPFAAEWLDDREDYGAAFCDRRYGLYRRER
jgi:uncharacterized DUF497 family protein